MSGIFEPLYGKNVKAGFKPMDPPIEVPKPAPGTPDDKKIDPVVQALTKPFVKKAELSGLLGELDTAKVWILCLAVALAIVFVMLFWVNSQQKKQRATISSLHKRLKRYRNS